MTAGERAKGRDSVLTEAVECTEEELDGGATI
jgi:hypothetical protein